MSALLADLRRRRVRLSPEGDRLRCVAPAGVLTPELTERIQRHKNEIIHYLRTRGAISPGNRPDPVPLSFTQESQWLLNRLEPADTAYHIPLALRLTGPLRPVALRQALTELARRHEVLRTTYPLYRGRPWQRVADPAPVPLPLVDLSGRRRAVRVLTAAAALRPFDLSAGPVMRTVLVRLRPTEHLLLLTRHHIASDGWSFGVLAAEIESLYAAFTAGTPARLPELAVQYADFAGWQRRAARDGVYQARVEQWRDRLRDAPRPPLAAGDGSPAPAGAVRRILPASVTDRVRALAQANGTTLFTVLLTGFGLALASCLGEREVVVGTPASGRVRPELEPLLGCFATMLPLRLDLAGDPSFARALRLVHDEVTRALADQDIPLELIIQAVRPERRVAARCPLFSVAFVLQNTPPARLSLPGVAAVAQDPVQVAAKFPLTFTITARDDELACLAEFARAVDPAGVREILDRFETVLDRGSAEPGLRRAELVRQDARVQDARVQDARVQAAADAGPAAPSGTLAGRFRAVARTYPDAVAVTGADGQVTYGELYRRAERLAAALQVAGVGPETLVGLCVEPSAELVVAVLGICLAGAAYLPLDPGDPPLRHELVIGDSGIAAMVAGRGYGDSFAWFDGPVLPVTAPRPRGGRRPPEPAPANLAYVIYTSGSTGAPKGVMVSHANVTGLFEAADRVFDFSRADVWTLTHSSAFDFSVWEMWGALLHGARLVVPPRETVRAPDTLWRALAEEQVTVFSSTPGVFLALLPSAIASARRTALRAVILGGERCEPAKLGDWFEAFGDECPRLVNMYGITETTVHATHRRLTRGDVDGPASPVGRPLAGVRATVTGPDGVPVAVGGKGELLVGGGGVARGYLRRPGLTADRFRPDALAHGSPAGSRAYRSGDLVRLHADAELGYVGRTDQQIQLRGHRIEPGEVEAALAGHPAVATAAVTDRREGARHFLVAYVVPHPARGAPSAGELRRYLAERLPPQLVPAVFCTLDRLPLTRNGKLDWKALPAVDVSAGAAVSPPRTDTERALAALWCELLGLPAVGVHDNFFELGGDSLLVTRMHARLPALFDVDLPMQRVYRALDIATLAEAVEALRTG